MRIARLDLLLDHADPGDTRGFRRDLDRLFDPIGEVVELTVRVFRTGLSRQNVDERHARGDDDRIPHIRMDVRSLRQFFPRVTDRAGQRTRVAPRREPDHDETVAVNRSHIRSQASPHEGVAQQRRRLLDERSIG